MNLDVNECEISNGGCQHQCRNTNGSYLCQSNGGFFLDINGKTCTGKFDIMPKKCKWLYLVRGKSSLVFQNNLFLFNFQ